MKLQLTINEAKWIILEELKKRGHNIKPETFQQVSHIEGAYEDAREVFDGFSVELAQPKQQELGDGK